MYTIILHGYVLCINFCKKLKAITNQWISYILIIGIKHLEFFIRKQIICNLYNWKIIEYLDYNTVFGFLETKLNII